MKKLVVTILALLFVTLSACSLTQEEKQEIVDQVKIETLQEVYAESNEVILRVAKFVMGSGTPMELMPKMIADQASTELKAKAAEKIPAKVEIKGNEKKSSKCWGSLAVIVQMILTTGFAAFKKGVA